MKWVWVTPIMYDKKKDTYTLSENESLINPDKIKHIDKISDNLFTVWYVSDTSQDSIIINRDAMNSIMSVVEVK